MSTMSGYMAQKLLKWLVLLALVLFIVAIVIFLFGKPSFSERLKKGHDIRGIIEVVELRGG